MDSTPVYPSDRLPHESLHDCAVRVKYGLAICRACGWPVAWQTLDEHRWCPACRPGLTDTDQA